MVIVNVLHDLINIFVLAHVFQKFTVILGQLSEKINPRRLRGDKAPEDTLLYYLEK